MRKYGGNGHGRGSDGDQVITETDQRLIRLHVDYLRRTGATARTLHHRRENVRRYAEALPVPLLDATPEHCDQWQSGLRVSLSSVATYSSHVRGFYGWAVHAGHIDLDPTVRGLVRTKVPKRAPRPIPADDFELALRCADDPIYTWLVLGAFMGLRAHEVAQIEREDITEGLIGGKRRTFISGIGKGAKPYTLPVPADVLPILQRHITGRPGPLWRNRYGRPLTQPNLTEAVSKFFRSLDMPYTMHCTRHTYGTELQKRTRDLLVTREAMRHTTVASTQLYVQPIEGAALTAIDQLASRLGRTGTDDHPPPRRRRAA